MRTSHVRLVAVVLAALGFCTASPWCHAQEWTSARGLYWDGPRAGRLGLVANLHAYDLDSTAVVSVRGLADLLGGNADYRAPYIVMTAAGGHPVVEMRSGSSNASVDGVELDMGGPLTVFSGIACAPIRFLSQRFGASIDYRPCWDESDYVFSCTPRVVVTLNGKQHVIIVHRQPPGAVARFIDDMENTYLYEFGLREEGYFRLATYGTDWILDVGKLASDGKHFCTTIPATWSVPSPLSPSGDAPAFDSGSGAVYGLRNGKWRLLISTQDGVSYDDCDRLGLPYRIARELGLGPYDY